MRPEWPAPPGVAAFQTVRDTGELETLTERLGLPAAPSWLAQVHGATVAEPQRGVAGHVADAAVTRRVGTVLAVSTADCLPVLFCDRAGSVIAAAHAGWRGLAAGVLEATVAAMEVPADSIVAWAGPAIGQDAFEVGPEVRAAFVDEDPAATAEFVPGHDDRYHADLSALARRRLRNLGVLDFHGGHWCTVSHPDRFHSYRRDGGTGRMASLVWLVNP